MIFSSDAIWLDIRNVFWSILIRINFLDDWYSFIFWITISSCTLAGTLRISFRYYSFKFRFFDILYNFDFQNDITSTDLSLLRFFQMRIHVVICFWIRNLFYFLPFLYPQDLYNDNSADTWILDSFNLWDGWRELNSKYLLMKCIQRELITSNLWSPKLTNKRRDALSTYDTSLYEESENAYEMESQFTSSFDLFQVSILCKIIALVVTSSPRRSPILKIDVVATTILWRIKCKRIKSWIHLRSYDVKMNLYGYRWRRSESLCFK